MLPRSRRYGQEIDRYMLQGIKEIKVKGKKEVDDAEKWLKGWTGVIDRLNKSGLWSDLAKTIQGAIDIGYDKVTRGYAIYWEDFLKKSTEEMTARVQQEVDPRLPIEDWDMLRRPPKVKKMYFGKYQNEHKLEEIGKALAGDQKFSCYGSAGYDISFSYYPDDKKAFYSEEYKGCGNGHYYLALDSTHALFYEDD